MCRYQIDACAGSACWPRSSRWSDSATLLLLAELEHQVGAASSGETSAFHFARVRLHYDAPGGVHLQVCACARAGGAGSRSGAWKMDRQGEVRERKRQGRQSKPV
jgi:hypothetical protein